MAPPPIERTIERPAQPRLVMNAGCGPRDGSRLPAFFDTWRQLRVDVNPAVAPDLVASITDLSAIETASIDAIWSAHCVEHLYGHEVDAAFAEFHRVLAGDGFVCIIVPDLQSLVGYIGEDRLLDTIYTSPAGPVTAHDMLYGLGTALAQGNAAMAHRCGFTPTVLMQRLHLFDEVVIRRRAAALELAAVARKTRSPDAARRNALLAALAL